MNNFIVIPDSFKGSMSSAQVADIMCESIRGLFPAAHIERILIADGGEGTVDAFLSFAAGERVERLVSGPFGEKMPAAYALINDGRTAVIEMAACAGLPLVAGREDALRATTYGVGELAADAVSRDCREIVLGLGGSCTNDFGAGMAAALGAVFTHADGKSFVPTGGTLVDVAAIDLTALHEQLGGVRISAMCDITNPLYGANGAACVFAPQKGADPAQVVLLDQGLRHIARIAARDAGVDVSALAGAGAAGGMGGGARALLGATLQSGINTILDAVGFDNMLAVADAVFTGEGKIDAQSVQGKVISGIATRAAKQGVPVIAVVGAAEEPLDDAYELGVTAIFTINRLAQDFALSRHSSPENLRVTMNNILRVMKL